MYATDNIWTARRNGYWKTLPNSTRMEYTWGSSPAQLLRVTFKQASHCFAVPSSITIVALCFENGVVPSSFKQSIMTVNYKDGSRLLVENCESIV